MDLLKLSEHFGGLTVTSIVDVDCIIHKINYDTIDIHAQVFEERFLIVVKNEESIVYIKQFDLDNNLEDEIINADKHVNPPLETKND